MSFRETMSLPKGVVHGDMHPFNVLYEGKWPVAIADIDFLQRGVLLYDIAYTHIWLTGSRDRGIEWRDIERDYLAAYSEGRGTPLSSDEHFCVPWFRIRTHMLFFLRVVGDSWDRYEPNNEDWVAIESIASELGV